MRLTIFLLILLKDSANDMEAPLSTILNGLIRKAETLGQQREALLQRCKDLQEANSRLEAELAEAKEELRLARLDSDYLTVSHRLAQGPQSLAETRLHIARLIRRLDASIRMLEDDPAL